MDHNIKIHDVVTVVRTHKDKEEGYWGNAHHQGVVLAITAEDITIKEPSGETNVYTFDEKEYTSTVHLFSEIEYAKLIAKAVKDAERRVVNAQEHLDDCREWQETFRSDVSFLGKLLRMVRSNSL